MEKNYRNLLWHTFFGNFDTGVIFIFLSFFIWDEAENMFAVAVAFMIPIVINTVVDYFFSHLSDSCDRRKLIIAGNVGSAVLLGLYGLSTSIFMLYGFIFLKSLFAKIYNTSLSPFIREAVKEEDYKSLIAKLNVRSSIGGAIGGFTLMMVYVYTESLPLIFMLSGLVELFSTIYLIRLKTVRYELRKEKEDDVDMKWLKNITIIYAFEAFGIALIVNRIVIFLYDTHGVAIEYVGIIFFVAYGLSNMVAAQIYGWFEKIRLGNMLVFSYAVQAIVLVLFATINNLYFIIGALFVFELVDNVTLIYTSDRINKSLFTNIGKRLSRFRVIIALGGIVGQLVIGQIWDRIGVNETFYFTSLILIIVAVGIVIKRGELEVQTDEGP